MATVTAPSGRRIWQAVRDEWRLNLYPLPFTTIAPAVYHVYLHPEDFATIEGITPTLVEQIRTALSREVDRTNRAGAGRVRGWVAHLLERDTLPPIEMPASGWDVHIRPDANGELAPGQLGIVSTLAVPAPPDYGGTPTTRIVRAVVSEGARTASVREAAGVEVAATPTVVPAGPRDRARLRYHDDAGPHEFVMRKDALSSGRGGSAAWVDVQVVTGTRVSREHLRLRVDAAGQFFVQDVSLWGVTIDDVPVPPALKGPEGVAGPGPEVPLPRRARIGLAGLVTIEFEAQGDAMEVG